MDFEEFYKKHKGFLWHCANRIAKKYGCLPIKEDLVSEGMLAAFRQIDRYDEQRGASVTTFLHPHIIGAMRRESERYLNWSRRELQKGKTQLHARKNSLDEVIEKDSNPKSVKKKGSQPASDQSVEQEVYIDVCLEHLRAAFGTLSFRERETLGGFFGVFGYKKETLAEIGETFQIKESAALKAKDKALEKLRRVCLNGELGYWMNVRVAIRKAQRDCFAARGDLGRYSNPEGCEIVE